MNTEVKIPSVGESITSGILSVWHKKNGESVTRGQTLLTLETDKVSSEVAAEISGVLEILVEEGREVKIGEVVGRIAAAQFSPPVAAPADTAFAPPPGPPLHTARASTEAIAPPAPPAPEPMSAPTPPSVGQPQHQGPPVLSPAARRLSEEESIPTAAVTPSGPGGRITKEDIQAFIESRRKSAAPTAPEPAPSPEPTPIPAPEPAAPAPASPPPASPTTQSTELAAPVSSTPATTSGSDAISTRKRLSPLRRKIAEQLVKAQNEAALLTTFNECDMTAIKAVRERMQENFQRRHGVKLGFMSFFVKSVVNALQEIPAINARIDGEDLVQNHFYDIGVAVGTERGLIVPVVRAADRKSFGEIEQELAAYATRAREGRITLDDLRGGVFTISNGGVYGSLLSTPIVNPPQCGILGMHKIQDRPVAVDGAVVVRPMMYLAFTYDHRVVDGKEAVTFLARIREGIEDPMSLLL